MSDYTIEQVSALVKNAYNSIANKYNAAYSENDLIDYDYLTCFIENIKGKNVLDMGCGCGESTSYLAKKGLNVIGIDFAENMLLEAKKLYPDLTFENQNILSTSFDDQSFDGIVLTYVINHFSDDGLLALKKEIHRLLKKGGLLFLSVHQGNSESVINDPLDENIHLYFHFLDANRIDSLFSGYTRIQFISRKSLGPEEFDCDKFFVTYRKD